KRFPQIHDAVSNRVSLPRKSRTPRCRHLADRFAAEVRTRSISCRRSRPSVRPRLVLSQFFVDCHVFFRSGSVRSIGCVCDQAGLHIADFVMCPARLVAEVLHVERAWDGVRLNPYSRFAQYSHFGRMLRTKSPPRFKNLAGGPSPLPARFAREWIVDTLRL